MSHPNEKHITRDTEEAMRSQDAHSIASGAGVKGSAAGEFVPAAEENEHNRSHAAHLDQQADEHTKPEGNLRQGSYPGGRREPPQGQGRSK